MLFTYFHEYLQKLNPNLWVDVDHQITPYHKDFPHAGLYHNDTYIMGVPHNEVPEYTLTAINGYRLSMLDYPVGNMSGGSGKFYDSDFIENIRAKDPGAIEERILAKGYKAIISELVKRNLVPRRKASHIFRCDLDPSRNIFPKRYIDISFTN